MSSFSLLTKHTRRTCRKLLSLKQNKLRAQLRANQYSNPNEMYPTDLPRVKWP